MSIISTIDIEMEHRANALFDQQKLFVFRQTDRLFVVLMLLQWVAGIFVAIIISPRTWAGQDSDVHIHVWSAFIIGGLITFWPVYLALARPGAAITRHAIALGQMLYSALLIHLTGGRIESHFHVFGSLAFLSFYRDWRVLVTASSVVIADHVLRGLLFPQSVYGVNGIEPWRWLEHGWWVVFEDVFLIYACRKNVAEMKVTALRQAHIEGINKEIEQTVQHRTAELNKAQVRLSMQYAVATILTEAASWDDALTAILKTLAEYVQGNDSSIFAAYWSLNETKDALSFAVAAQRPEHLFDDFQQLSQTISLSIGTGLPGRVWASRDAVHISDLSADGGFLRWSLAQSCNLTAGFGFPVIADNQILGVFELYFAESRFDLNGEERDTFRALGSQIGQFIVRKQAEVEKERLANVVHCSNDAIFTVSAEGTIASWNLGAEKLLGYSFGEVKSQGIAMLFSDANPEGTVLQEMLNSDSPIEHFETAQLTKDGSIVDVSVSSSLLFDCSHDYIGRSVTMHNITERKLAERRVNEFYSIVSHELRTPLTSIRGALGLIEGGIIEGGSSEGIELIGVARTSADRLIRLINDILDLKKIESGKMEMHRSTVSVTELISATLQALAGFADQAGIELINNCLPGGVVFADYDRATQILTNLVSNAVKFSPRGSRVVIRTEMFGSDKIRFSVIDNGRGIAEHDLHRLFEKFQQLDSSDARPQEGTGLGLAICKALVEQHHGVIGVRSKLGNGSEFWFELPAYNKEPWTEDRDLKYSSERHSREPCKLSERTEQDSVPSVVGRKTDGGCDRIPLAG